MGNVAVRLLDSEAENVKTVKMYLRLRRDSPYGDSEV